MENSEQKICQSCGMPMIIGEDFGTNAGGSRNEEYCTYCFQNGAFALPDETLEGMIERLVAMSDQWGVSKEEARKTATENLPKLKRWEKE